MCTVHVCKRTIYADNLCSFHYKQTLCRCKYPGCGNVDIFVLKDMLCQKHYNLQYKEKKARLEYPLDEQEKLIYEILQSDPPTSPIEFPNFIIGGELIGITKKKK